jgi:hypothetical protein
MWFKNSPGEGEGRLQGYGDSQFSPSISDSVKERVVLYDS